MKEWIKKHIKPSLKIFFSTRQVIVLFFAVACFLCWNFVNNSLCKYGSALLIGVVIWILSYYHYEYRIRQSIARAFFASFLVAGICHLIKSDAVTQGAVSSLISGIFMKTSVVIPLDTIITVSIIAGFIALYASGFHVVWLSALTCFLCWYFLDENLYKYGVTSISIGVMTGAISYYCFGYRFLPSFALGTSSLLIAATNCSLLTAENKLWEAGMLYNEKISAFLDSDFLKISGTGILGTALIAVITESFKDLYARGYHSNDPDARIANRTFRKLQKNLITRRIYKNKTCNSLYIGIIVFAITLASTLFFLLQKKSGIALHFLEWVLFISAITAALGFTTHWFISESILIRTQFTYLKEKHNVVMRQKYNCDSEAIASRNDYYQVAVNLFFTPCDIKSDEQLYLCPQINLNGNGCPMRTASDFVSHYDSVRRFHLKTLSAAKNDSLRDSEGNNFLERQYHEILFAHFIYNFLKDNQNSDISANSNRCGLAKAILTATDCLVERQKSRWDTLAMHSIHYEDVRALIVLDVLNYLRYQYMESKTCPYKGENSSDNAQREALLYLEFPYITEMCLKARNDVFPILQVFGCDDRSISEYRECVEEYYWHIFAENTKEDSCIGIQLENNLLADVAESFKDFLQRNCNKNTVDGEIYLMRILPTMKHSDFTQSIILTTRQLYYPEIESLAKHIPGWSNLNSKNKDSSELVDEYNHTRRKRLCSSWNSWPDGMAPYLYGNQCGALRDQASVLTEILFRKDP